MSESQLPPAPAGVQTVLEFWINSESCRFSKAADVIATAKAKLLIPTEEIDEVVNIVSSVVRAGKMAASLGNMRKTTFIARLLAFNIFWFVCMDSCFVGLDENDYSKALHNLVFDVIFLLAVISLGLVSYKQIRKQETSIMIDQAHKVASMLSVWNKSKYLRFGFAFEEYSTKGLCLQAIAGGPSAEFCPGKASVELSRLVNYEIGSGKKRKVLGFGQSTEPPPQLAKAHSLSGFEDNNGWESDEQRIKTGVRNTFECKYAILLKYSTGFKRKSRTGDRDLIKSSIVSLRNRKEPTGHNPTPLGTKRLLSSNSQLERVVRPREQRLPKNNSHIERSEEIFILSNGDEPWEYAVPSEDVMSNQQPRSQRIGDSERSDKKDSFIARSARNCHENLVIPEVSHHSDEEISVRTQKHNLRGPINSRQSIASDLKPNEFQEVEEHLNDERFNSPAKRSYSKPNSVQNTESRADLGVDIRSDKKSVLTGVVLKPELVHDEHDWQGGLDYEKGQTSQERLELDHSHKSSKTKIVAKDIVIESPKHATRGLLPVPIEVRSKFKERSRDCSVDSNDSRRIPGGKVSRDRSVDSSEGGKITKIVRVNSRDKEKDFLSKSSSLKQFSKPTSAERKLGLEGPMKADPKPVQSDAKLIGIEDFATPS